MDNTRRNYAYLGVISPFFISYRPYNWGGLVWKNIEPLYNIVMKGDLTQEIAEKLAKLMDLEAVSNDHSNLICGLVSLEYTMKSFISHFESEMSVKEFVTSLENTRNSFFFHYIVLERMMADNFPMYLTRIRRIAMIADEGFEMMFRRFYKGQEEIDPIPALKSADDTLVTLINEMYDQFEGLNYLYPNPYRNH